MKRPPPWLLPVFAGLAACSPGAVLRTADDQPISRGSSANQLRQGPWTIFAPNGARLATGEFADGVPVGPWKMFHPDGSVQECATLVRGIRDGAAATWHGNGQLESRGRLAAGVPAGPWVFFAADGALDAARTGHYRNGTRIE
jgi:antitoxin component YwqK of YwqJK toxin-antitoxin module